MSLTRRDFGIGMCSCAALSLLGCAAAPPARDTGPVTPGYRPAGESDELGLWATMDRAERELADSRFLIRDPALAEYLRTIACRLAPEHCGDLRQYVVRTPLFNASMAPNGMTQVWSGLLLRCLDEAQLAAVIGHEMGHYLQRHTLQRFRDLRDKANFSAFLGLGLAAGGVGLLSTVSDLALLASIFAFSREQEREADAVGLELMSGAGYAPIAAAEVWEQLIEEMAHSTAERDRGVFFATHPAPEERVDTLRNLARDRRGDTGMRGRERHREGLRQVRSLLLDDELALRQYGRSEALFARLLDRDHDDGYLWFAKGEVHRLRGEEGDDALARAAYARAARAREAPPELHRSRGLVALRAGDDAAAREAFEAYLRLVPDAGDRAMIRSLMP
ncbi:MAG: M48 family metalloprotease [Gammaproteobacteria bacterium]|nr:M48 family metalloprotease [Gammaproteobacteria bacterium]